MRSFLSRVLAFALTLFPLEQSLAQRPACASELRTPIPTGEHAWCATDSTPRLIVPSGIPLFRYPDILRAAGVGGQVMAEVTVTDSGLVEMGSVRIVHSSHDLLANAVKSS